MKSSVLLTVMVLLCAALTSIAQITHLPISSQSELLTYALEQTASVSASIGTSLPSGPNTWGGFIPVKSPTVAGISNAISGMYLAVDVANPKDALYAYNGAYDSDGDVLFSGFHQFWLENAKGGYTLPVDYGNVPLVMVDNPPIKIPGAIAAQVSMIDASGRTGNTYSLPVRNGKVFFPRQLAGTNAVLSVFIQGEKGDSSGGWLYWNVGNGGWIYPDRFTFALKTTVQGITAVTDSNVRVAVPTSKSVGKNQSVEFTSTSKQSVTVSFWTTEGKWFNGAKVRKAGTTEWTTYEAATETKTGYVSFPLGLSEGVYYIVPLWNEGDLVEPADTWYPPYYGDGGKG